MNLTFPSLKANAAENEAENKNNNSVEYADQAEFEAVMNNRNAAVV